MLKDYELSKALDIIEKWCLENNFTENNSYMYSEKPEYHRSETSIQINFVNDL